MGACTMSRQLNIANMRFAPEAGGTPIPIPEVTDWNLDNQAKFITGAGDGDMGPSSYNKTDEDPRVQVTMEDLSVVRGLSSGMRGTLTWTVLDAESGVGTGAINYTLTNSYIGAITQSGRFRQY